MRPKGVGRMSLSISQNVPNLKCLTRPKSVVQRLRDRERRLGRKGLCREPGFIERLASAFAICVLENLRRIRLEARTVLDDARNPDSLFADRNPPALAPAARLKLPFEEMVDQESQSVLDLLPFASPRRLQSP